MQSKLTSGAKFGRYEVLRRLASGGMAQLCLARQTGSAGFEKRVALKVLHPHMAESETVVKMFVHEASIAAQLTHPNVVHVLDLGQEDDQYYIAMEYIAGTNLRHFMHRATKAGLKRIPLWALVQIAIATCDGLQYIHDFANESGEPLRLVHRDISPENIMVSFYGAVKLVDFGVLRIHGVHHTGMGEVVGKPHYMAPEQIRDQRVDRRADLFSLGVVLYESLCGRRPFQGEGAPAIMMAILHERPTPLREVDPSVSPELERIVMKLLARRPDDRYAEAAAVREDLVELARAQGLARDPRQLALLTASLYEDSPEIPAPIRRLLRDASLPGGPRSDIHVVAAARNGDSPVGQTQAPMEASVRSENTEDTPPIGAIASEVDLSGADESGSSPERGADSEDELDFGTYEPSAPLFSYEGFRFRSDVPPPPPPAPGPAPAPVPVPPSRPGADGSIASVFEITPGDGETTGPPDRHALLFEEGLAHVGRGAYDLALAAWEEASRLAPDNRSYAANLKKLRARIAAKPR